MSFQPRIPITFESADGNTVLTFPTAEYEVEEEQGLYVPESVITGGDGVYDMLGNGRARKQSRLLRIRAVVYEDSPTGVDTEIDDILSKIMNVGRGKLWTTDSADDLRWTWARPVAMPSLRWAAGDILRKTVSFNFRCGPYWFAEDLETEILTVAGGSPDFITVTNPGNAPVFHAVITIKGTFTDPVITNDANGYRIESLRDGTNANHWLRFDCERRRVEFSTDGGVSWAGDYDNFIRTPPQIQFMVLEPGDNLIEHASLIEDGTLEIAYYPAFH